MSMWKSTPEGMDMFSDKNPNNPKMKKKMRRLTYDVNILPKTEERRFEKGASCFALLRYHIQNQKSKNKRKEKSMPRECVCCVEV